MRFLGIGRTEILYDSITRLVERSDHHLVGIITARAAPEQSRTAHDFANLAADHHVPFHVTENIDERAVSLARESKAEAAISVNWVTILGDEFTKFFPHGVLNAHLGDLPRLRGNAAANWAIVLGEPSVTLTVHVMEPGVLDSGPVLLKRRLPLTGETKIADVLTFARSAAPEMFEEALDGLAMGTLDPEPQDRSGIAPVRAYARLPRDGRVDWRMSAAEIDSLVRATGRPYPGAFSYYRALSGRLERLHIWQSRVEAIETPDIGLPGHVIKNDSTTGASLVYTGQGILALLLVSHDSGEDFQPGRTWRSTRMRLGMDVEEEVYRLARKSPSDD